MTTEDVIPHTPPTVDMIPEVFQLDHRYNDNGDIEIVERSESRTNKANSKYADKALIFRRIFDSKHRIEEKRLDINSKHILKTLSEVVKYYPSHATKFDDTLEVKSPYLLLYHHWKQLAEQMDRASGEQKVHLKALLDFLDREIGRDRHKAGELEKSGYTSYSLLWTLFRPGDLVLQDNGIGTRLYRFTLGEYRRTPKCNAFLLHLSSTAYNGLMIGRETSEVAIKEFCGTSEITSLAVFPLECSPNRKEIKEKLTVRGKKYLSLRGVHVKQYNGEVQVLYKIPYSWEVPKWKPQAVCFKFKPRPFGFWWWGNNDLVCRADRHRCKNVW